MIDKQKITEIYTNLSVPFWIKGKNVTKGWVNIECPFCADSSNHCGVNPNTELFHCWKCGKKGHFVDLLMELTGLPFGACKSIIADSTINFEEDVLETIKNVLHPSKEVEPEKLTTPELPERFKLIEEDTYFPLLDSYLKRRRFSRSLLIRYKCGICMTGEYMNRLIIPVYYQEKLVSFQAADLSGFASLKYRSAPLEMGRINDFLYGLDEVDKRMIVVEGVPDKWRTGIEAVASFTSALTPKQIELILSKNLDELYICFDCELRAYYRSVKEAEVFKAYIPKVEVLMLPHGMDPDEAGREAVYRCIEETK